MSWEPILIATATVIVAIVAVYCKWFSRRVLADMTKDAIYQTEVELLRAQQDQDVAVARVTMLATRLERLKSA